MKPDLKDRPGLLLCYLIRLRGKPVYVGIVTGKDQTVHKRFDKHCRRGGCDGQRIHTAIQKHGRENFTVEIIGQVRSRSAISPMEIKMIARFRTYWKDGGLNGSRGGYEFDWDDPEFRAKLKQAHSSPEFLRKMERVNRRLAANPEWKRKHLEAMAKPEAREKLSKAMNRRSTRRKLSKAMSERVRHPDWEANDQDRRAKIAKTVRSLWADPKWSRKNVAARRSVGKHRGSKRVYFNQIARCDQHKFIIVLRRTNPHTPGTLAHREFELLLRSRTVGDYVKKSKDNGYLWGHIRRGNVRLE